jgi:hypothetical protein
MNCKHTKESSMMGFIHSLAVVRNFVLAFEKG